MHYAFEFQSAVKVQGNPATQPGVLFFFLFFCKHQYYKPLSQQLQWTSSVRYLALCGLAVRAAITFK